MSKPEAHRNGWLSAALLRYERPLMRYAHRLVGQTETARDVVQDCFLRLLRQPAGKVDGHLAEWLFTVCRNRALDHLRKDGRMDALGETEIAAATAEPVAEAAKQEEAGRVLATLETLPLRQREVVHLKFREGLSYKQIGAVCDTSASNVGFLLHTALKTLRERLGAPATVRTRKAQ